MIKKCLEAQSGKSIVFIESKTLLSIKWGIYIKGFIKASKIFSKMHKACEGFVWIKLIYMILKGDRIINIEKSIFYCYIRRSSHGRRMDEALPL